MRYVAPLEPIPELGIDAQPIFTLAAGWTLHRHHTVGAETVVMVIRHSEYAPRKITVEFLKEEPML